MKRSSAVFVRLGHQVHEPTTRGNAVWRVDLQPADANSHLIVRSTGDVTVQLVVNQGKSHFSETAVVAP